MLKTVAVYQVLIWVISAILFGQDFFKALLADTNLTIAFFTLVVIGFSAFIVYSNVCLLFDLKQNYLTKFLKVNVWSNFFQIFHLSILGLTYYVAIGIHFLVYYFFDQSQDIRAEFDFFKANIGVNYHNSSQIIFGINVVPLIVFFSLTRVLKTGKAKRDNHIS